VPDAAGLRLLAMACQLLGQLSHALNDVGDAHEGTDDALKLALRYGRDHELGAAKILPLVVSRSMRSGLTRSAITISRIGRHSSNISNACAAASSSSFGSRRRRNFRASASLNTLISRCRPLVSRRLCLCAWSLPAFSQFTIVLYETPSRSAASVAVSQRASSSALSDAEGEMVTFNQYCIRSSLSQTMLLRDRSADMVGRVGGNRRQGAEFLLIGPLT
jgi:hypothetical protein